MEEMVLAWRNELHRRLIVGDMRLADLPDDMSACTSFAIGDDVTRVGTGPVAGRTEISRGS
jgi:hypothetical protein